MSGWRQRHVQRQLKLQVEAFVPRDHFCPSTLWITAFFYEIEQNWFGASADSCSRGKFLEIDFFWRNQEGIWFDQTKKVYTAWTKKKQVTCFTVSVVFERSQPWNFRIFTLRALLVAGETVNEMYFVCKDKLKGVPQRSSFCALGGSIMESRIDDDSILAVWYSRGRHGRERCFNWFHCSSIPEEDDIYSGNNLRGKHLSWSRTLEIWSNRTWMQICKVRG